MMFVWYLVMWGLLAPPFEAGQYQSYERCEAAAVVQVVALREHYGPLRWQCRYAARFDPDRWLRDTAH
jgi:hypothetical protein